MNKGLEALKDIRETYIDSFYGVHRCEIIEKELKENEETKKELAQIMKDYQDLEQYVYQVKQALKNNLKCNIIFGSNDEEWSLFFESKNKRVEVAKGNNKQEYELLKEVLSCKKV